MEKIFRCSLIGHRSKCRLWGKIPLGEPLPAYQILEAKGLCPWESPPGMELGPPGWGSSCSCMLRNTQYQQTLNNQDMSS